MINEVLIAGIFFLSAISVQIVGTNISDKRNHKRNLERLEEEHKNRISYMKKEFVFNKKIKAYESIIKLMKEEFLIYQENRVKKNKKMEERLMQVVKKIGDTMVELKIYASEEIKREFMNYFFGGIEISNRHKKENERIENLMEHNAKKSEIIKDLIVKDLGLK